MEDPCGAGEFDRLVAGYCDRVYRLACAILLNRSLAEEASQETFIRIWKGLLGFRERASLSTWIYAVTRNTCATYGKRERKRAGLARDELPVASIAAMDPLGAIDLRRDIAGLRPKYRAALLHYYFEDCSYQQVSEALAVPVATVKTYLYRARKELLSRILARGATEPNAACAPCDQAMVDRQE
jgi:RNA polymerase sigma-70 factor, ECF subfamily